MTMSPPAGAATTSRSARCTRGGSTTSVKRVDRPGNAVVVIRDIVKPSHSEKRHRSLVTIGSTLAARARSLKVHLHHRLRQIDRVARLLLRAVQDD